MTTFLRNIFSSCLGTLLALGVLILVLIAIGSAVGSLQGDKKLESDTVLNIKMPNLIPERTNNAEMGWEQSLNDENIWSIHELVYGIEQAAEDKKIKALMIEPGNNPSFLHTDLIRTAINRFKKSGKLVYTYSENYSQGDYYLASVADRIFLHPMGAVELKGFGITQPYMKQALDNIGVTMEVYYAGDFKSATEPVRANEMSDENRLQLKELLMEIHTSFVDSIAAARGLSYDEVNGIIQRFAIRSADDALNYNLIDQKGYESEMFAEMRTQLELDEDDKLDVVNFDKYRDYTKKKKNYKSKDKIAVVYAEGELRPGGDENAMITDGRYLPLLRKIRKDDKIKAVVLRVNSPGGDVFTSDNILRELELIQEAGKPVIASMGDVAASGGYYISMGADSIFASAKTITGSIGVYAMFPNVSDLLKNKMNVYMDTVSTSPYANFGNMTMERSEKERVIFQSFVDTFYVQFLDRVAKARDMTRDEVHKVAQGRIWMGEVAVENGLVDKIGELDDAINCASKMAELDEYRLVSYPTIKNPIQKLAEQLEGKEDGGRRIMNAEIKKILPEWKYFERALEGDKMSGFVEYTMPYQIKMD